MNKLFMLVGLPASGKTTCGKRLAEVEDALIVSSDEIRKELLGNQNDQTKNEEIFKEVESRIINGLKEKNVIYDATNINYKRRMAFLQKIKDVEKIALLIATPYDECIERNNKRERKVPEDVIKRMYYNFYIPQYYEGFDEIRIYFNTDRIYWTYDLLKKLDKVSQDNPHHTLTIGKHCRKTAILLNDDMSIVGLLHDIGKAETKTFMNTKGIKTEIAHYYHHENVSAYMSLFYTDRRNEEKQLEIANLIQWHMLLHKELSEKTIEKYKKLLGEKTWLKLKLLYNADILAK